MFWEDLRLKRTPAHCRVYDLWQPGPSFIVNTSSTFAENCGGEGGSLRQLTLSQVFLHGYALS